jgi:hypothetical protein
MRQCPVCRTTYTDESLRFCLADGNALVDAGSHGPSTGRPDLGTEQTIAMPTSSGHQMRVDIAQPSQQTNVRPHIAPDTSGGSSGTIYKVVIALLLVGLLVVVAAAAGLFLFLRNGERAAVNAAPINKPVSPQASPTKNESDDLRGQIANLERMLNEQKRSNQPAKLPDIPASSEMTTTARVNSPNDGFLALRTLPNSELGDRILKIPHGAVISVGECGPVITPVNRSGRWCQASYNGYRGWVFDAFLVY